MFRKVFYASFFLLFIVNSWAQDKVSLWKDFDVKHGDEVTMACYLADNNGDSTSVIICPGGSYYWLDKQCEGEMVARWLQSNGISAFVLHYRTAGFGAFFWRYRYFFRGRQHPDMLTDAQRALQWVKEHDKEYGINKNKVGIMGFSAGGHLAMSTACFFNDNEEVRPAFVAAIYPVVTMEDGYAHKRSRRALLGERRRNNETMRDSLSLERHIPNECPPVFIVNCIDDPVVDYHNSVLLDAALTEKNIEHVYFQYQTGGHGFGASETKGSEECRQWKNEFINWIQNLKI